MRKLMPFFGGDLAGRDGPRFLSGAHRQGYTLLALDSAAMATATKAGLPYTVIDDWLDPVTFVRALETAIDCERNWFEPAREEFTVDGICWPDIDRYTTNWFWQNAMLSLELIREFKAKSCQDFRFFRRPFRRASVWNSQSDVCNSLWKAEFPGQVTTLVSLEALRSKFWSETGLGGLKRITALLNGSANKAAAKERSFPPDSLVLVMGYEEALRFDHIVQQLKSSFTGKVVAVIGGPYAESSAEITSTWNIPVHPGAMWPLTSWLAAVPPWLLPRVDPVLAGRFVRGYQKALAESHGKPWEKPLRHLGFHFEYYCKYRWPKLHKHNLNFWIRLWEEKRPAAILITSRSDTVFILAGEAAKRLGIRTFLIPHAGAGRYYKDIIYADSVLYGSPLQKVHLEPSSPRASLMVGCKGLLAREEYPVQSFEPFSSDAKWRILVLVEPTGEGPNLNKYTSPRAQLKALQTVADPPANIADHIDLAIKLHPNNPDLEIIEAAGSRVRDKVMPLATELRFALKNTDLVVAINFEGTALIHCMLMGKPVISFETEKKPMSKRPDIPRGLFRDGTTTVRSSEELWTLVTSFFADPRLAESMRLKAEQFAREKLDDSQFPSLPEVIKSALSSEKS